MNALRRLLGLCVHAWGQWCPVFASDGTMVGWRRQCIRCRKWEYDYFPDGH